MDHRERRHHRRLQRHAPARHPGHRRQALSIRWLAAVLLVGAVCGPPPADAQTLPPLLRALDLRAYPAGTLPPAFSGRALDARTLSLADLRGQVVVLNFWATWCLDCRPEMPVLERLHRQFGPEGLAVVGINAREERETVRRYAAELGLSFPLVLDTNGAINTAFGVIGLPTTFVVGRDGRAVALAVGPREWSGEPAAVMIRALLDERPAARPPR